MPTKKKRLNLIPDNLPAVTTPEETCPSLFTGQKLAERSCLISSKELADP